MATVKLNSPSAYLTGAICVIKLNDKIVGFSNGINYQIRIEARQTNAIDSIHPLEIYPYKVNINGQIHNFMVNNLSPTRMKVMPIIENILISKYVSVEVYRKDVEGNLHKVVTFPKSLIIDRSETIPAGQAARQTLTFTATSWEDHDTEGKQKPYTYDDNEETRNVIKYLEPLENRAYVPDLAREYVTGTIRSVGSSRGADLSDSIIHYSTKALEVSRYIGMDWDEDENLINTVKNQKK